VRIWRRIHLVPFTVTIPEEERDENYRERYLVPELPGILNWMLEGLKMYKEIGLKPPIEIQAATKAYRAEMDVIEQWLGNNCIRGPNLTSRFKSFTRIMRNMWKTNLDVTQHRYQKESLVTPFLKEALKPQEREPDALERG
jgi:phage/plasmid-associated DNA primase